MFSHDTWQVFGGYPLGIIEKNKVLASFFKMPHGILCFGSIPPNTLINLEGFHISITMFLHPLETSYDVIMEEPQPNCCWFNLGNLFVKGKVL